MLLRPRYAIIVLLATFWGSAIPTQAHSFPISALAAPVGVTTAANAATGVISGKVTRLDGTTAIAGASVKAYQGIVVAGTATTNATGDYTIGALSTGTYSAQASAAGYESTTQTGIAVTDGASTTLNVTLPVPINYVYDDLGRSLRLSTRTGTLRPTVTTLSATCSPFHAKSQRRYR